MIGDTVYIIEMNGCEWVGAAVGGRGWGYSGVTTKREKEKYENR